MAELLCIKHNDFADELKKQFDADEKITSVNLFDTFVQVLSNETNVLSPEKLKGLVFRQVKVYGDFDVTMTEVADNISGIKQSTQEALSAIDSKDTNALRSAYEQLKSYEERILKLEEDIYTDETTGIYNRKYLANHELDKEGKFKTKGTLIHISITNFAQINKTHGHESGDAVLRFVSKMCQKTLSSLGINLVRYVGVQLVAVSKEAVSKNAVKMCTKTIDVILGKKFKSNSGSALTIELEIVDVNVEQGEDFQKVYENL